MSGYIPAALLGAFQGVSELFPISSLGHSIVLSGLFGWGLNQETGYFLVFLVATHLATAIVLFLFYWREWVRIIGGMLRSLWMRRIDGVDAKIGWLLASGTVPAGLLGVLFQKQVQDALGSPDIAALCIALNGVLLWGGEILRRRAVAGAAVASVADLSFGQSIGVGVMQALALIPGFSRTGASLAGGLLVGLSHEDALRFSFLLATPIIAGAAVLKIPDLLSMGAIAVDTVLVGALCSALFAYLSVKFLTRYFSLESRTLKPFAIYCIVAGLGALALFNL